MASNNGFTPTEKRLMDVLSDWKPHTKEELCNVIDDQADEDNLRFHIKNIRIKIGPKAQDVICRYGKYHLASISPPGYEE